MLSTTANPSQRKAITTTEGPVLIIAGPGSGKTFTLVERIVYIVTEKEVQPENLLVVTFTNKAAAELTTRVSTRLNELKVRFNLNEMYLGTFHSICLRWLEENREFTRLKRNFTLLDQFDQQYFLYQRLRPYEEIPGIEHVMGSLQNSRWYKSGRLLKWLNLVAEEALDIPTLVAAPDEPVAVLGQAAALYHQQLEEANALDFSTIQYEALRLLRDYPGVLSELQSKITYMMVDEYQDTNTIQELILSKLAGDNQPNLCVVGDDDQSLYRFRGATVRNILEFKEKFDVPDASTIALTTNYRSHPDIINFCNHWISSQDWSDGQREFRFPKATTPDESKSFPDVPAAIRLSHTTEAGWHQETLDFLYTLRDDGHLSDWNQVAFLFRSVKNHRAVDLARFLEANGIPVYSPRSNQFFDREEIRLMIGALIFLFPQFPEVRQWEAGAHLGIWDYYDEECFAVFASELRNPENADLRRWAVARARDHYPLTNHMDYAFSGLFYDLLRFPLFSRYLDKDLLTSGLLDSRAMRNLAIFSQLLNKFEYLHHIHVLTPEYIDRNLRDLFNHFFRFLSEGGIDEYEDDAEYAPSGAVSFLTIHQSKGLEFPVVMVDSLEAVPRKQYTDLDVLLQEKYLSRPPFEPLERIKYFDFWRLYYTAFSRAQNLLVLTTQENRGKGQKIPSRYFVDFFDELPSWREPSFNAGAIPLASIKDVRLKRDYSFTSHITLYENCAEQYRFFKELEFSPSRTSPILFGTVVHQTIEDIHKTVLRGEENILSEEQIADWFDTNYVYLTKRERAYLTPQQKAIALRDVLRYYHRHNGDWSRIREAEVDVSLVKEDYILSGTVDLIEGKDDTVEIVDFKSERKPDVNDPVDRERIDRYRRQLEIYAHIVEERTGLKVSKIHLYYTREESGIPTISWQKNDLQIDRTIAAIEEVVHRIEDKDFHISQRPTRLCKECDLRSYCDANY